MDEHSKSRGRRWGIGAGLLAWVALAAAWVERLGGRGQDDLYVIYRYAWNLAHGQGFVYNPGERVLGLSEPGLGLLLAGLHRLTGIAVPELGSLVFAVALVALAGVLLVAADRRGRWPEGLLGGTVLLAGSLAWVSHGAGAPLFLALLAGAAALLEWAPGPAGPRRGGLAGALTGLAVWVRPDAAAGAAILGLLAWWRDRRLPVAFGLAAGALLAAGAGAAWLSFGSLLPDTLGAKRVIADAFLPGYGADDVWRSARGLVRRHAGDGWWLLVGLGAAGAASLWRAGGLAGRLLVAFAAVVGVTYSVLRVGLFSWYLFPVAVAVVYGFAFAVGSAARWTARAAAKARPAAGSPVPRLAAGAVALALVLPVAVPLSLSSLRWAASFDGFGRLNAYRDAGEWIRLTSPPGARVATLEIGVVGFYAQRPLGDLLGLVSPESLPHVAQRDLVGALRAQDADLVVARSEGRMRRVVRSPWFRRTYEEAIRFPVPKGRGWVAVYRRSSGPGATPGMSAEAPALKGVRPEADASRSSAPALTPPAGHAIMTGPPARAVGNTVTRGGAVR